MPFLAMGGGYVTGFPAGFASASLGADVWRNRWPANSCSPRPRWPDPNFARTVVLIGAHDADGAMGVVLNRPSTVTVGEAVPQLEDSVGGSEPVFVGGPVQPSAIVYLAEFEDPADAGLLVMGRIGFPSSEANLDDLATVTSRGRVFAGYAGWGAEQARRRGLRRRLDPPGGAARGRLHRLPRGPVERRAHPQGRLVRPDRPHAARPEPQLSAAAMPSRRIAAIVVGLAAAVFAGPGAGRALAQPPRTALVVFYEAEGSVAGAGLSLGLVSAAQQAGYARARFLLDATQGAPRRRVPPTVRRP